MAKKPKVEYHGHDSDFDGPPIKYKSHKDVMDYVNDTFISDSPVHVEAFHDGVSQGVQTYDPKHFAQAAKDKFAFRQ